MNIHNINIAIDGFSGCGKSSTARSVASAMGYVYLDTGAMYRAITYGLISNNIPLQRLDLIEEFLNQMTIEVHFHNHSGKTIVTLNKENVEAKIRGMEVSNLVSEVSKIKIVRDKLLEIQRKTAENKGIVMDGRDIGTVVLPNAELKIFMKANVEVRAIRRQQELKSQGMAVDLQEIKENFKKRDKIDSTREIAPLVKAKDAVELDTSNLSFEEQVSFIINLAQNKLNEKLK